MDAARDRGVARGSVRGPDATSAYLERWRAGEVSALDPLVRRYQPALRLFVDRRLAALQNCAARARIDPDDVLQECLKTAIEKLGSFEYRGPGSLYGWMETIAANKVSDAMDYWEADKRSAHRERPLGSSPIDTSSSPPDPPDRGPGPRTSLEVAERDRRLAAALNSLPGRMSKILMLRSHFDAEWADIAAAVGSPSADAVRKEHSMAAHLLAAQLRGV